MVSAIVCPDIVFASAYSLDRIASQLSLEALSLKGHAQWSIDFSVYASHVLLPNMRKTRYQAPFVGFTLHRGLLGQDFHL